MYLAVKYTCWFGFEEPDEGVIAPTWQGWFAARTDEAGSKMSDAMNMAAKNFFTTNLALLPSGILL
jgi:hypothetical protein